MAAAPAAPALLPGRCPHSRRSSRSQGKAETGRLHTGGLGGSPAPESEGTGSVSLLPTEICLSVCLSVGRRDWSTALTRCQAIPLRVLRGLLVLQEKVWLFLLVNEMCLKRA